MSLMRTALLSTRCLAWALLALQQSACTMSPRGPELHAAWLAAPLPAQPSGDCVPQWHPQLLPGKSPTRYSFEPGHGAVSAQANASASLLRYSLRIEPSHLGSLSFSWKFSELLLQADLRQRGSADSAARVVLAFDGDTARLPARTRALFDAAAAVTGEAPPYATLMYVWDARAPVGEVIVSTRTDRIRKIVVESGAVPLHQWRSFQRDIVADFRAAYGEAPGALVGIALMTDADNTAGRAAAWYGPVCLQPPRAGGGRG
jgi:hypothetical protein